MDIAKFRTEFPEFTDTTAYPNPVIEFWAALAEKQVLATVWGDLVTQGVKLYVAHEITLAAQNKKAASTGGVPGSSGGIANSKTVGSVSVGYDSTSTSEKDAGYWNLTNYGKQFIRLARIFGAGAYQL
jgi:hypothetical protein